MEFVDFPKTTRVINWRLVNIYSNVKLGEHCKIGAYVEIGPNVKIGDRCIISAFAFIPEGVIIDSDVFIGPRVTFCNDKYPPSDGDWKNNSPTFVSNKVAIGANATILPSIQLGYGCMVGAGAVVTKSVGMGEVVAGNPARVIDFRRVE